MPPSMLDENGLGKAVGCDGEELDGDGDGAKKERRQSFSSCIVDGEIGITKQVQEDERRSIGTMGSYRKVLSRKERDSV